MTTIKRNSDKSCENLSSQGRRVGSTRTAPREYQHASVGDYVYGRPMLGGSLVPFSTSTIQTITAVPGQTDTLIYTFPAPGQYFVTFDIDNFSSTDTTTALWMVSNGDLPPTLPLDSSASSAVAALYSSLFGHSIIVGGNYLYYNTYVEAAGDQLYYSVGNSTSDDIVNTMYIVLWGTVADQADLTIEINPVTSNGVVQTNPANDIPVWTSSYNQKPINTPVDLFVPA